MPLDDVPVLIKRCYITGSSLERPERIAVKTNQVVGKPPAFGEIRVQLRAFSVIKALGVKL